MDITYNGVNLKLTRTNVFKHEPVPSADGSDFVTIKHTIDVNAVYNPKATSYTAGPTASTTAFAGATDQAVRHALSEPRGQLVILDAPGGNVLLSSPPTGNTRDVLGGPYPEPAEVTQISGTKTMMVRWRCTTYLTECPGESSGAFPLVSNRWEVAHSIAQDKRPIVAYNGIAQFRMDGLEDVQAVVDYFRSRCIPPTPQGFERRQLQVRVSPRGDTLMWTAMDEWRYVKLGDPSTSKHPDVLDFQAHYGEVSQQTDKGMPAGMLIETFSGHAIGKPDATRTNLLTFLIQLALARISLPVGQVNVATDAVIVRVGVREALHEPAVSFDLQCVIPAAMNPKQGTGGLRPERLFDLSQQFQYFNQNFDIANGLCPTLGADNNTRSNLYLGLAVAQGLTAPCSAPTMFGDPGATGATQSYSSSPAYSIPTSVSVGDLPTNSSGWSQENSAGIYSTYRIDARYRTKSNKLAMPIAGPVSGSTQSGHTDDSGNWVPDSATQPTVEIMTLAPPTSTMVMEFEAERIGAPPVLPDPNPTDNTFVLMDKQVQQTNGALLPNANTQVFRAEGRYEYAMKRPVYNECMRMFPVVPSTGFRLDDAGNAPPELVPYLFMGDGSTESQDTPTGGSSSGLNVDGVSGNT